MKLFLKYFLILLLATIAAVELVQFVVLLFNFDDVPQGGSVYYVGRLAAALIVAIVAGAGAQFLLTSARASGHGTAADEGDPEQ